MAYDDLLQKARNAGTNVGVHDPEQMAQAEAEAAALGQRVPPEVVAQDPRYSYLNKLLADNPQPSRNALAELFGSEPTMLWRGREIPSALLDAPAYPPPDSRSRRR